MLSLLFPDSVDGTSRALIANHILRNCSGSADLAERDTLNGLLDSAMNSAISLASFLRL